MAASLKPNRPIVETIPVGSLRCNAYIIGCPRTGRGLIIDPGDEAERILERVRALGLTIDALVHTHTHFDHIGASRALAENLGAPVVIHTDEVRLYAMMPRQRQMFALAPGEPPPPADRLLEDGEEVRAGDICLRVIHTPGHTLGSICLEMDGRLFSGDTLFQGSVGRTDLGGTSLQELVGVIKDRLYRLDDGTEVLPGHGEATSMGIEKRLNPYLTED